MGFEIYNVTKNRVVASRVKLAQSFLRRLKGLMFEKKVPPPDEALVIKPCYSIHSFFMNFPIDAAFVDRDGKVLEILRDFRPWRISPIVRGSRMVIETAYGILSEDRISVGDIIEMKARE